MTAHWEVMNSRLYKFAVTVVAWLTFVSLHAVDEAQNISNGGILLFRMFVNLKIGKNTKLVFTLLASWCPLTALIHSPPHYLYKEHQLCKHFLHFVMSKTNRGTAYHLLVTCLTP